jgi:hypothetical protein
MGPPGRDGVGRVGPKGPPGDHIADWTYDLQNFRCTPIYSNGKPGKPLEFGLLLEAAYQAGQLTDDMAITEEMVEEYYQRDYEAKMARFRNSG